MPSLVAVRSVRRPRGFRLILFVGLLVSICVAMLYVSLTWRRAARHLNVAAAIVTPERDKHHHERRQSSGLTKKPSLHQHASTDADGAHHGARKKEQQSTNATANDGVRVVAVGDLKKSYFYRMQDAQSGQWLSRTVDTNAEKSLEHERILLFNYVKHYDAWSIQGHTRMHLTCELNDRVTVDRKWARSFEMWMPSFTADGFLVLQSRRNKMFLRTGGSQGDQLMADVSDAKQAARWRLVRETSAKCSGKADSALPKKEQLERLRNECWGAEAAGGGRAATGPSKYANVTLPLFGSPKPLASLAPKDAGDHYDTFIISNRTLHNWAMIPGVEPFLLADDSGTQSLVARINNASAPGKHRIALQTSGFEIHRDYHQPTYRGLFDAALKQFPNAVAVMYSNSDILYTASVIETVRSVVAYVERERERIVGRGQPYKVRGWMIVGQRVNHDVPAQWALDAGWERTVETDFAKQGDLFESDAEDYFIVSRGLFDWLQDIPDFVVGGVAFDNWITNKVNVMALRGEAIEVDGSKTIVAVHQNHGGDAKKSHEHPKSIYNSHLAVRNGGWTLGHTADSLYATERRGDGVVTVYDKHRLLYP